MKGQAGAEDEDGEGEEDEVEVEDAEGGPPEHSRRGNAGREHSGPGALADQRSVDHGTCGPSKNIIQMSSLSVIVVVIGVSLLFLLKKLTIKIVDNAT
jgi:hypothetical protein